MITVDERGCGAGKTTTNIYKRIKSNLKNNINTLVVVPSINLQKQYLRDLGSDVTIINSEEFNKENYTFNTTTKAAINAIRQNSPVVIITHSTFLKMPTISQRKNYDLIIDEALEEVITITEITISDNSTWSPDYDIENLFHLDETDQQLVDLSDDNDDTWYELSQTGTPNDSFLSESPRFKEVTNKNYTHWVTPRGWRLLSQQTGGNTKIINVLDPFIITGYKSIMIAAAAFSKTKMYHWLKTNKCDLRIPTEYEFKEHKANIKIYSSDIPDFNWSNNKRKSIPEILRKYHVHVEQNKTGSVLVIRNNGETSKLSNEIRLSHNVHGLNDLMSYTNVSLESALIPDPVMSKFISDNWLFLMNKNEQTKALTHMFSSYLFYQVIMRTKIRHPNYNNELISIFVLDQSNASNITEYFDVSSIQVEEMDFLKGIKKPIANAGRPPVSEEEKKKKRTERNKRYQMKIRALNDKK